MRRYTDVQTRKDLSADINRERLAIGQRWFRLALAWSWSRSAPKTEAERQVAIRHLHPSHAVGAKAKNIGSLAASLDKVENLAAKIRQARVLRWRLTLPSGALYYNPTAPNAASQRPLAERLQLRIARLAEDTLLRTTSAPARDSVVVRTTTDPARLGLVVSFDLCCPYSAGRTFTLADAKALGFCDYGIRSWCHRVGIDPDGQATIEQIIAGYKSAPVSEARQFILHYCR